MNIWQSGNPLTRLLLVMLGGLVFLLLLELTLVSGSAGSEPQADSARLDGVGQSAKLATIADLEDYQPTIDNALFYWNRTPRTVTVDEQAEEGELASRWRLTGVINTGSETYAIFNETDGSSQLRLGKGMYLEKWRIDEISPEQIYLSNDDEQQVFRLKETASENATQNGERGAVKRVKSASPRSRQNVLRQNVIKQNVLKQKEQVKSNDKGSKQ